LFWHPFWQVVNKIKIMENTVINGLTGVERIAQGYDKARCLFLGKRMVFFLETKGDDIPQRTGRYFVLHFSENCKKPGNGLMLGFRDGFCGVYSKSGKFEHIPYLEDALSMQFGVYLTQEMVADTSQNLAHLNPMVLGFASYLLKKYHEYGSHNAMNSKISLSAYHLNRIDHYVTVNADKTITNQSLSEMVGLSECHFIRKFKEATGTTPSYFIKKKRMEIAKRLLLETPDPVITVGHRSGYDNPSHFAQVFKKFYGITPQSFRRKLKPKETYYDALNMEA